MLTFSCKMGQSPSRGGDIGGSALPTFCALKFFNFPEIFFLNIQQKQNLSPLKCVCLLKTEILATGLKCRNSANAMINEII